MSGINVSIGVGIGYSYPTLTINGNPLLQTVSNSTDTELLGDEYAFFTDDKVNSVNETSINDTSGESDIKNKSYWKF